MWISVDGVAHTIAAPDWRLVIRPEGEPPGRAPRGISAAIEDERLAIYEMIQAGQLVPGGPRDQLPVEPFPVPAPAVRTGEGLKRFVRELPEWWRLDVLDALEEWIESATDERADHR